MHGVGVDAAAEIDEIFDSCAEAPVERVLLEDVAAAIRVYEAIGMHRVGSYRSVIF